MKNPYSKPQSGSYKPLLIEGLTKLGKSKEAEAIKNSTVKFAINSTITGNVTKLDKSLFLEALNKIENSDVRNYYIFELENDLIIPASTIGVFTYDENNINAKKYVEEQIKKSNTEILNPYFS